MLGSCVSITLWHRERRLGGMCHYLLPSRKEARALAPDGRYGDEAMRLLERAMHDAGTVPAEYQAKIFGGGRMFSGKRWSQDVLDIGTRNIEAARRLLHQHGMATASEHLAGIGHRSIVFDISSGDVWVRHMPEPVERRDVA
ncbi:MAG TPA: chemotaxis protein CheD [Rhodocyclaceae bacterium]|nr:chemotaxis protein CheD [Rhodocyclaceae bacterium]